MQSLISRTVLKDGSLLMSSWCSNRSQKGVAEKLLILLVDKKATSFRILHQTRLLNKKWNLDIEDFIFLGGYEAVLELVAALAL